MRLKITLFDTNFKRLPKMQLMQDHDIFGLKRFLGVPNHGHKQQKRIS
jgi:hypothetical protein